MEANQIAGAIVAFHRDMDAFHRKVQQFNRELQQSLDENLGFESVSRVTVEVKSVIRELEYWRPIEAMAEDHRAWLRSRARTCRPPSSPLPCAPCWITGRSARASAPPCRA